MENDYGTVSEQSLGHVLPRYQIEQATWRQLSKHSCQFISSVHVGCLFTFLIQLITLSLLPLPKSRVLTCKAPITTA